jgi:hypothetical protein
MARDNRRTLTALAVVILIPIGTAAWLTHYPASPLVTAIGLSGPEANGDARCGATRRRWRGMWVPTRETVCRRFTSPFVPGGVEQDVTLDALTRRIDHARLFMRTTDSVAWQRTADSLRAAVRERGGVPTHCVSAPWPLPYIRTEEHWIVGSHFERLIAYRWADRASQRNQTPYTPWNVQLDAFAERPAWCLHTRWGNPPARITPAADPMSPADHG